MNFEVIHNLEDNRLREWNELLNMAHNPLPFQKYEWVSAWWKNFSTDKGMPFIILAYQDNELVGIAPFMYGVNRSYPAIKFIGAGYFDYFDFIIKKGRETEAVRGFLEIVSKKFEYFELELKNILEESDTFRIIKQNASSNYLIFLQDIVPSIELPDTKEKFYYRVKGALRWDIGRRERRLRELGETEFKSCENITEAKELLEDFFSLHIKKWESANGYSAFKFEKMRGFMRAILENLFRDKTMNLYYLLHDHRKKIAICPAFELNSRFVFYTHAYDPDFAKCSPGKILINRLINHSIDNQYREFDFGIGKEPYKLEWPCRITKLYDIYIFKDRNNIFNNYFKLRRCIFSGYSLRILPLLRKYKPMVYVWRWFNRKISRYRRFQ